MRAVRLDFDGATMVPGDYTVCEREVPAGWTSTWTVDGEQRTPYNLDDPDDVGNRCLDFDRLS